MALRFRVWMPLVAVLIVLLSIATLLLYVLPAVKSRLAEYVEERTLGRAAAAASAVAEGDNVQSELELAASTGGGEVLVVDEGGNVTASAGPEFLSPPPQRILRAAASGERMNATVSDMRVGVVPLVRDGNVDGGVVFVAGNSESSVYELFLRSGVEAAAIASILGGGLALLLATLLSRRVERLNLSAQAIERGDFSSRIEPGYGDELGDLAGSFNTMAARLEDSFMQLKEKGATLNAILNNLVEGVLATDLEGNVMFINLAARDMLGVGSEELKGEPPSPWKDFDLPEAVARCARGQRCTAVSVRSGETFLRIRMENLPEFDNHRGGVLVVMQDLSEGHRLEANQQRFLANAAHELKTPITTILGASELLLTEDEDNREIRNRFLNHIFSEAQRMQRLSDTLLRLARTGSDSREPDVRVMELGFMGEVAERVKPLAKKAGLTLLVEDEGGRVLADPEWLEQATLILLSNAVKHSDRGGRVWLRLNGGAITVEDEGEGISEGDLPHVFERFYRGDDDPGGFGLGLPICKDLVQRMGGTISIRSEQGVGTTVKIELPEVEEDAQDTDSRG